jgi:penicillin-binding protein 2
VLKPSHFNPVSSEIFDRQLKVAAVFILVVFGILVSRLWFLQIVNGPAYRDKSENNRIRLQDIPPFRGMILDRNGEVLVDNRPSYDLYMIPEEVQDRAQLLDRLTRFCDIDPEEAAATLDRAARGYPFNPVCLKRDISRDELASIESHRFDLPGVLIHVSPQRHYFHEGLASHVLGYVGQISEEQLSSGRFPANRAGDLIGKWGVERKWQTELNGVRGGEQVEVDAAGRKITVVSRKPPTSGADICLTIDKDLQALAEKSLEGKHGAVVALNPTNGEVLAMASSPSYDPNLFIRGLDERTWQDMISSKDYPLQNRAMAGQYPPGSIFKIVVALAALEEGLISPEEEVFCNGSFSLGDATFRCWKRYGHGKVNLHRALVESCDVYFYVVGRRLGVDKIAQYAKRMGLGKETGLDLGNEKEGLIPTSEWKMRRWGVPWQPGETVSTAIGQSFVLTTPLQVANLISLVFNGGHLYRPQVTRWVRRANGESLFEFAPLPAGDAGIRPAHLELVKKALVAVVNETRGTGSKARLNGIAVAGKTGTAQVVALRRENASKKEDDIPLKFRDHAWFVAIAPASDPKIAVSVLVEHGGHGGSTAAPIAKKIIEAYLGTPS